MMRDAYIFDAVRTPRGRGKKTGSLHEVPAVDLLVTLFQAMQQRNKLDTEQVDDVVLGCVTPVGEQGADIAKTATLYAGWSNKVAGATLSRFCGSGLEACNLAAMKVMSGMEDLTIGGGVESMSRVPMGTDGGALFMDVRVSTYLPTIPQGVSADLIATLEGFNRKDVDTFAAASHKKAAHAVKNGYFQKSIIPVRDVNGQIILAHDELIREATTVDSLGELKPSFTAMGAMGFDAVAMQKYPKVEEVQHVHHAGNSSGIVDGAALVLIGSKEKGAELGLKPRAKFRSMAVIGDEPTIMLTAPAPSSIKALKKAGLSVQDIDLFEINEAFAAVVMKAQKELKIDSEKINVNGGSIAMGHPLGATGAIILNTVLDELERRDKQFGLCTLCIGGGMGIATIIERV
ncbi:MAG: acetyl-CoA C-acetyltransferase [SAR324 cluster bacterium]|nr:acetyl-CoA C-acetyltransferase [SAR324 cluster bacterium]